MRKLVKRWWFWLVVIILTAFVVVHTYLAIWVRDYVNRKLSEIRGYRAHVAAVTLHLWRGAYQIHYLGIKKTSGEVPVPFLPPLLSIFPCNGEHSSSSALSWATSRSIDQR
jgi:hypothetical protein